MGRYLKTVTGAGGRPGAYELALDPKRHTLETAVEVAGLAERAGFDALFTPDLLSFNAQGTIGSQDSLTVMAALSLVTSHVGLISTVSTTFNHPFNLARQFGTLDHISNGRAAWNLVTSSIGEENYSSEDLPSPEQRYARAAESLDVINALYDSWGEGALGHDEEGHVRFDPTRVRPIDHKGAFFTVAGPLNIPPLPQRRPVQFVAGQSAAGLELAARYAEVVFTSLPTLDVALDFVSRLRARATELGRPEVLPLIMSSFHATFGATEAEALRLRSEKQEAIDLVAGRAVLEDMLGGIDLSDLPLDRPVPIERVPELGSVNRRRGRVEVFGRQVAEGLTLRELIIAAQDTGHWAPVGTPEQLADAVEERMDAGVLDVLSIGGIGDPVTHDLVVNGLLEELRRRGRLRRDRVGDTFRENLELPELP
ncbi:NtaA/DmoA family FMN-dependent monooxygenase [Occultella aeris]|uniref:Nitrilotriacetate monooxygenase component A n=1 Tax=Occultella aeris TaxID=2761496 RepID=A0A7M4DFP0_9MICO|nr:NtaA/DmoA family FMN-dependent monooxygenase [Occultella aeris]VZO35733.1 Nitrilotriacetate monooxygenase component A [Occultella aeris]